VDDLRQKYDRAISTAKSAGLSGFIGERDGRLFFRGTVRTQEQATRIWSAIKSVPTWRKEVVADIHIEGGSVGRGGYTRIAEDEPA
jgi:hypothetical protein